MSTDGSAGTVRFGENSSSGGTSQNAALAAIEGGEPSSMTSGVASSFSSGSDVMEHTAMVLSSGVGSRSLRSPSSQTCSLPLQARSGTASPRMLGNETVTSGSGSGAQTPASSFTMLSQIQMAALAIPSPRSAFERSAEQAEVGASSP